MKKYLFIRLACCIAVAVSIVSCSSPLKVTSDYDKSTNFTQYKTFAMDTFLLSRKINQLNQNRIVNAIRAELQKKGLTESNNPDLLVQTTAILKDQQSMTANTSYTGGAYGYGGYYRPYGWGGGMSSSYTTYNVQNYTNGSLIISIADAKTKNLVWEGIGNKDLDQAPKNPDETIPKAVALIMESYPSPGAPKK
jgi:hypothetical protein